MTVYVYTVSSSSAHPFVDTEVFSTLWLVWIMLQYTWECSYLLITLFSFPMNINPKVRLLHHLLGLFSFFLLLLFPFFLFSMFKCLKNLYIIFQWLDQTTFCFQVTKSRKIHLPPYTLLTPWKKPNMYIIMSSAHILSSCWSGRNVSPLT